MGLTMSYQLPSGEDIPFDRTMSVDILGSPRETYQSLKFPIRDRLWDGIINSFTDGFDVLSRIRSWKQSNGDIDASRHEIVFKQALSIAAPARGTSTPSSVSDSQVRAARELHEISIEFVEHLFGSAFPVYRGIYFELPFLVESLLNNPSRSHHYAPQSVVSNYSSSREGASFFSRLIVERTVNPSDIVLATNNLFVFRENEMGLTDSEANHWVNNQGYFSPNGELQINGDIEYPVRGSKLSVVVGRINCAGSLRFVPASQFFADFNQFDTEMHKTMWSFVQIIDKSDTMMRDTVAINRLRDWQRSHAQDNYPAASDKEVSTTISHIT